MTGSSRSADATLGMVAELGVAGLLVVPVLFFGGSGPLVEQVVQSAVFVLGALVAGRRLVFHPSGHRKGLLGRRVVLPLALPACLILLYGAAMALPLPRAVGMQLSPVAAALHDQASAGTNQGAWHPLTAAPALLWRALAKLASAFVFFGISAEVLASAAATARLTMLTVLAGGCVSILSLIQFFSGNAVLWGPLMPAGAASFGSFVNRNHFAQWAAMSALCGAGLILARLAVERETGKRLLFAPKGGRLSLPNVAIGLSVAAIVAAILASSSLGGIVGLTGGILFLGLLLALRRRTGRQGTAVLGLLLVVVTLFFLSGPTAERAWQMLRATGGNPLQARLNPDLLAMAGGYRLVGSGPGSFGRLFPLHRRSVDRYGEYDYAHNDYLQTLIEWGFTGAAGFLALGLVWGRKFFKGWYSRRNMTVLLVSAGAAAGVVASLVHAWIDFGLRIPAVHLQFVFLAALALRVPDLKVAPAPVKQPSSEVPT